MTDFDACACINLRKTTRLPQGRLKKDGWLTNARARTPVSSSSR